MPEKSKLPYLQRPCGHGRDFPEVHWWLVSWAKCNNYSLHMYIPKIQVSVFRICWNSTQEGMNWLFGHGCLCGASHSCLWPAHSPTRSEIRLGAIHLIALNLVGSRHRWEKGQTGTNLGRLVWVVGDCCHKCMHGRPVGMVNPLSFKFQIQILEAQWVYMWSHWYDVREIGEFWLQLKPASLQKHLKECSCTGAPHQSGPADGNAACMCASKVLERLQDMWAQSFAQMCMAMSCILDQNLALCCCKFCSLFFASITYLYHMSLCICW